MTKSFNHQHFSYRYERLPASIDDVFDEDVDLMASTALAGIPDLNQVKSYIQRQLTYRYTCQLTALYAAETAGKPLPILYEVIESVGPNYILRHFP